MKTDCVLLYGNFTMPMSKYAGTFRIATELRQHGYSVQTIDLTAYDGFDPDLEQLLDSILTKDTLWVGVSTTFMSDVFGFPYFRSQQSFDKRFAHIKDLDKNIRRFADYIKSKSPKAKLITGGSRRFMLEQFGFKVFKFYNDKEIIEFTDYCAGKSKNIDLKYLTNVIEGSEFTEFTTSTIEFEDNDIIYPNEALPIEISRGCIFRCKFCAFPMNGKTKGEWVKHTDVLLNELKKNYEEYGITSYVMSDDTYNDSADKVKLLYNEVYSKLPFKLSFTAYIRLDLMLKFPDTVNYLKESGLTSALFGIETINHESGKAIGKGIDPKIQFQFLRELKNNQFKNIQTHSGFIIGLPKDRFDEMERLEEFLFSNDNYLDHVTVEPLFITPKDIMHTTKPYYSEFDLEYAKYGYECYEEIENSSFNEVRWKNPNLGFDFDKAFAFSRKINAKIDTESDKFKYGGFAFPYMQSAGVTTADLMTLSKRQIRQKYNLSNILNSRRHDYRQKLLKKFSI
jgi:radical SAM superfamily enzyme YgiQ (UPF0313 family)